MGNVWLWRHSLAPVAGINLYSSIQPATVTAETSADAAFVNSLGQWLIRFEPQGISTLGTAVAALKNCSGYSWVPLLS